MNEAQFDALKQYRTSPLFNVAECAALDYVTELATDKKVNPYTGTRVGCGDRKNGSTLPLCNSCGIWGYLQIGYLSARVGNVSVWVRTPRTESDFGPW
jgi:hypothetical protein